MKTLKTIKLNHYADEELKEREMNLLRGGSGEDFHICVCYEHQPANAQANLDFGYSTTTGEGVCYFYPNGGITPHKDLH